MLNTNEIQQAFEKQVDKNPAGATATGPTPEGGAGAAIVADAVKQQQQSSAEPAQQQQAAPASAEPATQQQAGPDAAQMEQIRAYFKSQGIEMSPEEIASKVKESSKAAAPPPPAEPTVDDTELENYFASLNKKEKYQAYKAAKDKSDLDLVMEYKGPKIKEKFPNISDEQLEAYIKRSYFQDEDGFYEEEEKNYGATALKNEAEQIRGMIDEAVEGAKSTIKQGKAASNQSALFAAEVETLLRDRNKLSFNLGVSGQKDLGSWDFPLHEETKAKVKNALSTPQSFAKYISDPTGKVDLKKVMGMIEAYELRDVLAKSIATEFHSRGVSEVEALLGDGIKLQGGSTGQKDDVEEHNRKQAGGVIGTRYR